MKIDSIINRASLLRIIGKKASLKLVGIALVFVSTINVVQAIGDSKIVGIDFSKSTYPAPTNWNDVTESTTEITGLVDLNGDTTTIDLTVEDAIIRSYHRGPVGLDESLAYPDSVSRDYLYGCGTSGWAYDPNGVFKLNNLAAGQNILLIFFLP